VSAANTGETMLSLEEKIILLDGQFDAHCASVRRAGEGDDRQEQRT
jgi:hypothetical protein